MNHLANLLKYFLAVLLLVATALCWAEVPVIEAENLDNTLSGDNFNVVPSPMMPPSAAEAVPVSATKKNLPSRLPSKSLDVTAEANTSMLLLSRIDDLEKELQTLRGQLEVQNHKLSNLENKYAAVSNNSSAVNNVRVESKVSDKQPMQFPTYFKQASNKHGSRNKDDQRAYMAAYDLIKRKQFPEAIKELDNFVRTYPASAYLANAYYWLGELYLAQGNVASALISFDTVIRDFPLSNKVAGAMLKKGFAYFDKSDWSKARQQLQEVRAKYPDTTLSRLAASKLSEMERRGV